MYIGRETMREHLSHTFAYDLLGESGSFEEGVDELLDLMEELINVNLSMRHTDEEKK